MEKRTISEQLIIAANQQVKEKDYWLEKMSGKLVRSCFPRNSMPAGTADAGAPGKEYVSLDFPGDLDSRMTTLSNDSDDARHVILLAGLVLLLRKYTGCQDIIVGTPIYSDGTDHEKFINTVLPIRGKIHDRQTFKDLLMQMRSAVIEADEHCNYPIEVLAGQLEVDIPDPHTGFPLFDVVLLLRNIQDIKDIRHIPHSLTFSFSRDGEHMKGVLEYSAPMYGSAAVNRFTKHFVQLLSAALSNPETPLKDIEMLSPAEKKQILIDFNNTDLGYSRETLVHQLFEARVEKNPFHVALIGEGPYGGQLSYSQLNKQSSQVARLLREKGVGPDSIICIMVERSLEMITGLWGVLKAGGGYLPIDPGFPDHRKKFVLNDSRSGFLLTVTRNYFENSTPFEGEVIYLDEPALYTCEEKSNETDLENINRPEDLAYIIYTSGSTGRPKGVLVGHRNLLAYVHAFYREFNITSRDTGLQQSSFAFDCFTEELYPYLLRGGKLAIPPAGIIFETGVLPEFIRRHNVTIISCPPLLVNELNKHEPLNSVHHFLSGGDVVKREYFDNLLHYANVYNAYGPTETTVCATYYRCRKTDPPGSTVLIGKPIANYRVYILGKDSELMPVGVAGELCVAGDGVSRGYLNAIELTAQKFILSPFTPHPSRLYKTGDLSRWLPDGNIEFLGRIDSQVKIRGYRIETGEIETQLLQHDEVTAAAVVVKEDRTGDKQLCAYIVSPAETADTPLAPFSSVPHFREYLAQKLPAYMIPSYFIRLKKIAVTPNGKIDRNALPAPDLLPAASYEPPSSPLEIRLTGMWSEVLGMEIEKTSIAANFFEVGGHSLKAVTLVAKIHKQMDVKIPLAEFFRTPTIKGLAAYIKRAEKSRYASIQPAEKKRYYSLSSAQKRLYMLQQMEPASTAYNMPTVLLLPEHFQLEKLEPTFKKLIHRHESLRTALITAGDQPVQEIYDPGHEKLAFKIHRYMDQDHEHDRDRRETITEIIRAFVQPFDLGRAPLLRAGLIRLDNTHYLLMVDIHHIVSDGLSHTVLEEDFMALYSDQQLPPLRLHYKDYAEWQNREKENTAFKQQEAYWLKEFDGSIPLLNLPTDYPRPTLRSLEGSALSFLLDTETMENLKTFALAEGVTLYMLLFSMYTVMMAKICDGQEDIIIGAGAAGRGHADLQRIIGMFVNTLAIRTRPEKTKIFREFLQEVREKTILAFENQDYPFEDLVEKVVPDRDWSRSPLVEAVFVFQNLEGDPYKTQKTKKQDTETYGFDNKARTSKFDITLFGAEMGEQLLFTFEYCTKLFKKETIEVFTRYFKETISFLLENKNTKLEDIRLAGNLVSVTPDMVSNIREEEFDF